MLRGFIGENDHQVIIAIRTRIAARRGTEQVDAQRVIRLYQTPHHLGQHRVVGGRRFEGLDLGFRHAHQSQFATGNGQKVGLLFSGTPWSGAFARTPVFLRVLRSLRAPPGEEANSAPSGELGFAFAFLSGNPSTPSDLLTWVKSS